VPVDNLDAGIIGVEYFLGKGLTNPVIVSPDAGGVYRAKKFLEGCVAAVPCLALPSARCWRRGPLPPVIVTRSMNAGSKKDEAGLAMIIKQRRSPGEVCSTMTSTCR
jgi:hypothetical protein